MYDEFILLMVACNDMHAVFEFTAVHIYYGALYTTGYLYILRHASYVKSYETECISPIK